MPCLAYTSSSRFFWIRRPIWVSARKPSCRPPILETGPLTLDLVVVASFTVYLELICTIDRKSKPREAKKKKNNNTMCNL